MLLSHQPLLVRSRNNYKAATIRGKKYKSKNSKSETTSNVQNSRQKAQGASPLSLIVLLV